MPEIYNVAAVDAPVVPTDHHQAPSPEPPRNLIPQTFAAYLLVHVASLQATPEALCQYSLSLSYQHQYWEEVWPCLDHAPC